MKKKSGQEVWPQLQDAERIVGKDIECKCMHISLKTRRRNTSTGHPSTTNTSREKPSVVENTCASRILSPESESKAESWGKNKNKIKDGTMLEVNT